MAKKQDKKYKPVSRPVSQVDIVGQKVESGYGYINNESLERLNDINYIPEHIQSIINPFVRKQAKVMDDLIEEREGYDKNSEEHDNISLEMEKVAKSLPVLKDQIVKLNQGTLELKEIMGSISPGAQDSNLYTNFIMLAGQGDSYNIDDEGKISVDSAYGPGKEDFSSFRLDDASSPTNGQSPIVVEPFESKTNIWRLAEETKQNQVEGKSFDEEWTFKRIMNELTNKGASNTIGLAFADLAGDGQTKSFADQWDDGLADPYFYIDPETGKPIDKNNLWMKNPANYAILQKFLGRYITDIMKDVHGEIEEETGQIKKSQADIAQEIIKKYSK